MLRHFCAVRLFLGFLIILVLPLMQQGLAQDNPIEDANGNPVNVESMEPAEASSRWLPPKAENKKDPIAMKASDQPAKVRIGLRLTPFKKISTRNKDNSLSQRFIPIEPIRHTLRARLNKINHFFIGEWHIETKPMSWIKKTRKYSVRLSLYRRFGAFGQLEEFTGAVDLEGTLDEGDDNVHVLLGVARKRLRDKFGHPILDVVAGFTPGAKTSGVMSANDHLSGRAPAPAKPPVNYSGSLIRGRF